MSHNHNDSAAAIPYQLTVNSSKLSRWPQGGKERKTEPYILENAWQEFHFTSHLNENYDDSNLSKPYVLSLVELRRATALRRSNGYYSPLPALRFLIPASSPVLRYVHLIVLDSETCTPFSEWQSPPLPVSTYRTSPSTCRWALALASTFLRLPPSRLPTAVHSGSFVPHRVRWSYRSAASEPTLRLDHTCSPLTATFVIAGRTPRDAGIRRFSFSLQRLYFFPLLWTFFHDYKNPNQSIPPSNPNPPISSSLPVSLSSPNTSVSL